MANAALIKLMRNMASKARKIEPPSANIAERMRRGESAQLEDALFEEELLNIDKVPNKAKRLFEEKLGEGNIDAIADPTNPDLDAVRKQVKSLSPDLERKGFEFDEDWKHIRDTLDEQEALLEVNKRSGVTNANQNIVKDVIIDLETQLRAREKTLSDRGFMRFDDKADVPEETIDFERFFDD